MRTERLKGLKVRVVLIGRSGSRRRDSEWGEGRSRPRQRVGTDQRDEVCRRGRRDEGEVNSVVKRVCVIKKRNGRWGGSHGWLVRKYKEFNISTIALDLLWSPRRWRSQRNHGSNSSMMSSRDLDYRKEGRHTPDLTWPSYPVSPRSLVNDARRPVLGDRGDWEFRSPPSPRGIKTVEHTVLLFEKRDFSRRRTRREFRFLEDTWRYWPPRQS